MESAGTVTADSFASGTAAALAGGTTVILDFATQDRGHTLAEALETWHRPGGRALLLRLRLPHGRDGLERGHARRARGHGARGRDELQGVHGL